MSKNLSEDSRKPSENLDSVSIEFSMIYNLLDLLIFVFRAKLEKNPARTWPF
jgi:hypothetical protein